MTAKEKEKQDIMNEINRVPMSEESRSKMSLNIYDLQYLIRLQQMSNDAFLEDFKKEFCESIANKVTDQLAEVLVPIQTSIEDLEIRVSKLEKKIS